MQEHRDIVLQASPEAKPAIDELYTYLTSIYLPRRFPTMFSQRENELENLVTGERIPLTPNTDPVKGLGILGKNVDEDFLLMLPSDDGDGYTLKVSPLVSSFSAPLHFLTPPRPTSSVSPPASTRSRNSP
jgi:hypothetical protein